MTTTERAGRGISPAARNTALAAVALAFLYGFDLFRSHTFDAACHALAAGQMEAEVNHQMRSSGGRRYGHSEAGKIWYRRSVVPHRLGMCTVGFDVEGRSVRAEYATVWSLSR